MGALVRLLGRPIAKLGFGLLVLVTVATSVHINTLNNGFVYDDHAIVVNNPHIRSLSSIPRHFRGAWRPLKRVSLTVDYQLWGLQPMGFHLSNVLLHVLASFAVFALARGLGGSHRVALAASLLFASHPITTESVAVISHRKELLGTLFLALGLLAHARIQRKELALFVVYAMFGLSLLSKEVIGVALPLLLLAYDGIIRTEDCWVHVRRTLVCVLAPLGLSAAALLALRLAYQGRSSLFPYFQPAHIIELTQGALDSYPMVMATVLRGFWRYLNNLVYPIDLSVDYPHGYAFSLLEPSVLLAILGITGYLGAVLVLRRRQPLFAFGLSFVPLALLPVANVVPMTSWFLADRYLYLPSVGFALALAIALDGLARSVTRTERQRAVVAWAAIALVVGTYASVTIPRNRVWKDDLTLWTRTLEQNPQSLHAQLEMARHHHREGRVAATLVHYEKVLRMSPTHEVALTNLGEALTVVGRAGDALRVLEHAAILYPDNARLRNNLGNCHQAQGDLVRAALEYRTASSIEPGIVDPYINLGLVRARLGDLDAAVRSLNRALRLDPANAIAHFNLALVRRELGHHPVADYHLRQVLDLAPRGPLRARAEQLAELR